MRRCMPPWVQLAAPVAFEAEWLGDRRDVVLALLDVSKGWVGRPAEVAYGSSRDRVCNWRRGRFPSARRRPRVAHPRDSWYPMKPSDEFRPDGQLFSGGRGHVKHDQHHRRYVIRWDGCQWRVVRIPLATA